MTDCEPINAPMWRRALWMDGFNALELLYEIVVWIYDILDNNLEIKNDFTKYFKENCW